MFPLCINKFLLRECIIGSSASADPNTESVTKEAKSPTSTGIVTENVHEKTPEQKSKCYNQFILINC